MIAEHTEIDECFKISRCSNGDILLRQGYCGTCDEENEIRLQSEIHFSLIAEYLGLMTKAQIESKFSTPMQLMDELIRVSLPPEHPVAVSARVLLSTKPTHGTQLGSASEVS